MHNRYWAAIDIGNTHIKIGIPSSDGLNIFRVDSVEEALAQLRHAKVSHAIVASVRNNNTQLFEQLNAANITSLPFTAAMPLPFKPSYQGRPGADRLAAAYWAWKRISEVSAALIIIIGSCITYTLLNRKQWLDGAISPGLTMRLRAMHHFTDRLPQVQLPKSQDLSTTPALSTTASLQKGALHGVIHEVKGFIHQWQAIHPHLQIYLSGGDALYICHHISDAEHVTEVVVRGLLEYVHDHVLD